VILLCVRWDLDAEPQQVVRLQAEPTDWCFGLCPALWSMPRRETTDGSQIFCPEMQEKSNKIKMLIF